MQPPIASPFGDSPPDPITRRLEWDEQKGCFKFVFVSQLKPRFRCEWMCARHNWFSMIGFFNPIFPLLMWLSQIAKSERAPDRWEIYSWGVRENYDVRTTEMRWSEIRRILQRDGDLFLMRVFYKSSFYLTREDFFDEEEGRRVEALVRALREGQDWEEVKRQFAPALRPPRARSPE